MPTNKRAEPRAEKRAQLVESARELFVREGYEATPMSRIAQAAKVTPNTIYWYFEDKDQLLIAVLDVLLQEHLAEFLGVAASPLADQLQWLVQKLQGFSGLIATVHGRLRESQSLERWHRQFHRTVEQLFGLQLPKGWAAPILAAEVRIAAFTIEGLVTHEVEEGDIRRTCEALAARWLDD